MSLLKVKVRVIAEETRPMPTSIVSLKNKKNLVTGMKSATFIDVIVDYGVKASPLSSLLDLLGVIRAQFLGI